MSEPKLIQNAISIPEDDAYIVSTHVHDFVTHTFKDGKTISIDGGSGSGSYARRAGDFIPLERDNRYQEWCLTTDDSFLTIAERLLWGTRGKKGDQPLRYRPMSTFEVDHLKAILANCPNASATHQAVAKHWIKVKEGAQ